jgi:sugar phosphate isomerase/epimerase
MARDIVINLLAFAGTAAEDSQLEFFAEAVSLGVNKVEVRRERIKDFSVELPIMRAKAEELGLEIYYSVPAALFKAGRLESDMLRQVFQEAEELGATRVKFAVGEFGPVGKEALIALKDMIAAHNVLVTVEGDQSAANGRIEPIMAFMEACRLEAVPVYSTFDVGNFVWVGQEPLYNAVKLAPHVRYIHVKGVKMTPQGPQVCSLEDSQINWRAILALLPEDVPVGIEFPCGENPRELLAKTIQQIQSV